MAMYIDPNREVVVLDHLDMLYYVTGKPEERKAANEKIRQITEEITQFRKNHGVEIKIGEA